MHEIKCEWQIEASLGEGPLWSDRENAVYWVDIIKHHVHRLSLLDGSKKTWTFDGAVTSIVAREQGGFVGTIRDGFAFIDLENSAVEPIALPEIDMPGNRFNDAKVDGNGRFWGGSMDNENQTQETGALYRLDPDLTIHKMDDSYIIDNGPAFSLQGTIMYHTDSKKKTVYAFDLDEQGNISNKREFIKLSGIAGSPDGMTVDSEDCIWLCHFGGSRVTRYSPQGEILEVIPMPVPNITSCTFADSDLDTLYITTARIGMTDEALEKYPLAGSLFSVKPAIKGLPTPNFAG